MASKYKEGSVTVSDYDVDGTAKTSNAIDVRGYDAIAVQIKFATCTGSSNTATLVIQTSNDNTNWIDCTHETVDETNVADFTGDDYFIHLPDNATAGEFGFGKYIRFKFAATGTYSVSYTITYLLKG